MKLNISRIKKLLELDQGRDITWIEVSQNTGLHYETVRDIDSNTRIDLTTLQSLMQYFRGQGMNIDVGDLFEEISNEV